MDVPSLWGSRWYRQQHIRHRRSLRDIALNLIFSDSPVSAAHLIFFTAACVTIHPSLFCPTASHYISLQKFFSTPIRKHFATHNFASKQALCSVLFTTQRQFQEGACSCEAPNRSDRILLHQTSNSHFQTEYKRSQLTPFIRFISS